VSNESLSLRAYRHLHNEIINGRLPVGAVISESTVAKSLGISRTPVGEAVRLLVREGLVRQVPRYGTVVRHLERTDLEEHYELREALESYAAGQAAARATPADVRRIRELCEAANRVVGDFHAEDRAVDEAVLRRFLASDMTFHLAIVAAARNGQIMRVIYQSRSISRIFRVRRQRHDLRLIRSVYEYHCRIVDAIEAGDRELATSRMLEHIRQSKRQTLEQYDLEARRGSLGMPELPPDVQRELVEMERTLAASRDEPMGSPRADE
jgi:DNA-binding GntR family transcriptional regulator